MLKSYGLSKNGIHSFGVVGFSFINNFYLWSTGFEFLFLADTSTIVNGKLYNIVAGRESEYITVAGVPGMETYTCPDTQDYRDADSDQIWFLYERQRSPDKKELVCYDFKRTFIKYDDENPNDIRVIGIVNKDAILDDDKKQELIKTFELPIYWDFYLSQNGHLKNKSMIGLGLGLGFGQNAWTIITPIVVSAIVEESDPTHVKITYDKTLDTGYVPDVTAFTLAGKVITNVAIAGAVVTLTVSVAYAYGDSITVDYTKPAVNFIRGTNVVGAAASFAGQAVALDPQPEVSAYIAGLVTPLSAANRIKLNTLVKAIKTGTGSALLSDAFDVFYLYAGETQEVSLRNLAKNAHHGNGSVLPDHTALEGFQGAVGKFIELNYNPAIHGVKYTKNNASIGYYARLNVIDDWTCGSQDSGATKKSMIIGRNGSNQFWATVNTAGYANCMTNFNGTGMYIGCRESATNIEGYRNKLKQTTKVEAASDIQSISQRGLASIVGVTTHNSVQQLAVEFRGRSFTLAEVGAITDAIEVYMDANAKGVI